MLDALPGLINGSSTLFFPHIASDDIWETEICLINKASHEITGELKAYENSGQEIDSTQITLEPNARREITVGNELSNPGQIGYVIFETDSPNLYGYLKFYVDQKYRVAIPAASEINDGDIYMSHIASDDDWTTGISILNTTSMPQELTIEFDNGELRKTSMAANEHKAFTIRELFNGNTKPEIKSAVIRNGEGIVGLEIFGTLNDNGLDYLSGILLKDKTAVKIYYPHITIDSIWQTGIVSYNPSVQSCDLTITPFRADGTLLASKIISIAGKEKYIGVASELGFPAESAWIEIESTIPITGFELFALHPFDLDDDKDGFTENQGDCSDSDSNIYPGADEICGDDIDQDCDGHDLRCPEDIDDDNDGYTENQGDCNDSNSSIYPGAPELCGDGIDQDCDGSDLKCPEDIDDDGDGFTENQGDCNDGDPLIFPGATEICGDGIDQNCDGEDPQCFPCKDISGRWHAEETVNLTCCMFGECETDIFSGSDWVNIKQDGCNISYNISVSGFGTFSRAGKIEGNYIEMSGLGALLQPGCTATTNIVRISGIVNGDRFTLQGTLELQGSCDGDRFTCTGNSTANFSR